VVVRVSGRVERREGEGRVSRGVQGDVDGGLLDWNVEHGSVIEASARRR